MPWGRLLAAGAAALGLGAVTVLGFEALCRAQGLAPYFGAYAQRQLIASFVEGRANPQGSPLYYLGTLVRWELALPLALPLVAFAWRRQQRGWRALVGLGLWQAAVVVVGFSLAKQKNEWYLAPLLPAAAWVVGGALAALPGRLLRVAPHAAALTAAGWLTFTLAVGTRADTPRQAAIRAVTVTPLDARGAPVANCSVLGDWLADHLFAFHWNAARVACDAPAAWRFDGRALTAAAPPH